MKPNICDLEKCCLQRGLTRRVHHLKLYCNTMVLTINYKMIQPCYKSLNSRASVYRIIQCHATHFQLGITECMCAIITCYMCNVPDAVTSVVSMSTTTDL